jgi:hypothetical protein
LTNLHPGLFPENELLGEGVEILLEEGVDAVLGLANLLAEGTVGGEQGAEVSDLLGRNGDGDNLLDPRNHLGLEFLGEFGGVNLIGLLAGDTHGF